MISDRCLYPIKEVVMKYLNVLLVLLLMGTLPSCSNKKKKKVQTEETTTAEVSESENGEDADFIVDADEDDLLLAEDESMGEGEEEEVLVAEEKLEESSIETGSAEEVVLGEQKSYQVKKGDTLMLVAFKLYGDYARWKELAAINEGVHGKKLIPGTTLHYAASGEAFDWNPKGNPYLVRHGDTLGSISDEKYGTVKRWRDIWNNNKPMIKNPNLIFAGFTLYYVPDRNIASE